MKVLLLPDSFKGSLSAYEFCRSAREVIEKLHPDWQVEALPFSDGGEGFMEAWHATQHGQFSELPTVDALGRPMVARVLLLPGMEAVMEMAEASGLTRLESWERSPFLASSYGSGLLFKHLVEAGYRRITLGLGGTACNDGGAGFLKALGMKFYFGNQELTEIPQFLSLVDRVEPGNLLSSHADVQVIMASDVQLPLLGAQGATHTFALQKGALPEELELLEGRMEAWRRALHRSRVPVDAQLPGMGAAGGMAFGLSHFYPMRLQSGFELLAEHHQLSDRVRSADLVISGEGCLDASSFMGKLTGRVFKLCQEQSTKLLLVCGQIQAEMPGASTLCLGKHLSLEERMSKASELLKQSLRDYFQP
ncbi:MAG: glycerate kinase [Cytophagaceae bacterium]|jgi:glycerate kinase|nr:glycerate kinase [Cytophagaceae bacterium]